MARELSAVVDHVAKIGELDLDDVAPTSHVVEVTGRPAARRAARLPAARGRARRRRRPSATRAFSSQARRHERDGRARAVGGGRRRRRSARERLSARELFDGLPRARRRATARRASGGLNCFTWVAEQAPASDAPAARCGGVPLAVKDLFCTEGVPSQSGSRILEGYEPPYTATAVSRLSERGREPAGEDQPGRVRDGLLDRELGVRAGAQPVGPRARAGRLLGWERGGGRGRARAVGARHRHRRLDPPAGRAVRDRRAETDLRRGLALRHDRVRLLARSGGTADARRDRRGADAAPHGRPRPLRRDLARFPAARSSCRPPSGSTASGSASRGAAHRRGEGIEAGRARGLPRDAQARRGARRRACRRSRLPHAPHALVGLLRARARRRPPRTSRASTACATACAPTDATTCSTCTRARATTASARRSSGGSCSAPTRSPPATTTPTTAAPSACGRRSPRTSPRPSRRSTSSSRPTAPTVAFELGEKTGDPLGDVPERLLHRADVAGRHPRDLDPLRAAARGGLPVGLQIAGPAFSENRLLDAAHALEQAIGFDGGAARV